VLKDKGTAATSMRDVTIQEDGGTLSAVRIRSVGYSSSPPTLPVASTGLAVQFHSVSSGACWSKDLVVQKNSAGNLVAR